MNAAYRLPRIPAFIPRAVVPTDRAHANAGLARFLVEAGALTEADIPQAWGDVLEVCGRALDAWIKRQIGPLHCLSPVFVLMANDDEGSFPSPRRKPASYASATLCWAEREERQWVVGPGLDALERACAGLGAAVLDVLERAHLAYPLFTPDMARSVASYLYWYGEDNEEAALDEQCGDHLAEREDMRRQMVTRQMLECSFPAWACNFTPKRRGGAGLRKMAYGVGDARLRAIADDALALSRLRFMDEFRPDIEGEFIAWGAVLSWCEDDVTVRIYDDLINMAHQGEYCDRMGEVALPLDQPALFAGWRAAMRTRLRAIGLIDRLIHALSAGDWD